MSQWLLIAQVVLKIAVAVWHVYKEYNAATTQSGVEKAELSWSDSLAKIAAIVEAKLPGLVAQRERRIDRSMAK